MNAKFNITFQNVNKEMQIPETFDQFKTGVCSLFNFSPNLFSDLDITYIDCDKDVIYLSDNSDYEQLLLSIQDDSPIQVFIAFSKKSKIYNSIANEEPKNEENKGVGLLGGLGNLVTNIVSNFPLPTLNIFGRPKQPNPMINAARQIYDLGSISDDKIQEALDKSNGNIDEAILLLTMES